MKCETFANYLDGYLDGSLSELEKQAMEEHMQTCAGCRKQYEEQKRLLEELRHLDEDVRAPEGLVPGAMERIHRERQPRRRNAWIGGSIAAGLCVLLALGTFLGGGLLGGAKSADPSTFDSAAGATTSEEGRAESAEVPGAPMPNNAMMAMDTAAADVPAEEATTADSADGATSSARTAETPAYNLKIIREAEINIQTENYSADTAALEELVSSLGGFITSREEWGSEQSAETGENPRSLSMTLRIPSDQLDAFVEQAKEIGVVTGSSIRETDVTDQYTDTDRRLQAYQKQYDRVLEMMDQATTVEELIQIESELSRLEMEIENCQGTLNYWDARVNYSTAYVYMDEVRRAVTVDSSLGERMSAALADSWEDFTQGCLDLVVNLYASIPYIVVWVVVLAAAGGITVLIVRKVKKKRK
ncbi:MAG: DUF4349 domain-containing protein [Candidatus Spyradocola sp.]|jgi:hypothetical protein